MGIYFNVYKNKHSISESAFAIGYGGFFYLRAELAKLTGFEYAYTSFTKMINPNFDPTQPEDKLYNNRHIPHIMSGLSLQIPDAGEFTEAQIEQMTNFLLAPDSEGKLTRSQIKTIATMLRDKSSKNPNRQDQIIKFKQLLQTAIKYDGYIRWE